MINTAVVLIVEDNSLNMELFCDVLVADGFCVLKAEDAGECYKVLQTHMPDIILMDLQLPGKDGYTLIRELLENIAYKAIPIVALTAYAMPEDQEKILATGCQGIITKPINVRDFPKQIKQAIRRDGAEKKDAKSA
ncbi:response regulator [bacterium]|nr:response regulator [bacterium]